MNDTTAHAAISGQVVGTLVVWPTTGGAKPDVIVDQYGRSWVLTGVGDSERYEAAVVAQGELRVVI